MVQTILKVFTVLETKIQELHFVLSNQPITHFCSLTQKMGLKWAYRRLRLKQMADFDFLETTKASSLQI